MVGTPQYPDDWASLNARAALEAKATAASAQSRVPYAGGTLTGSLTVEGDLTVEGGLTVDGTITTAALATTDLDVVDLTTLQTLTVSGALTVGGVQLYPPLVARKTANENVNNSTVLQDDDHLAIAVEANAVYLMEAFLLYSTDPAADIKLQFTGPAGATLDWGRGGIDSGATTTTTGASKTAIAIAAAVTLGGITSNTTQLFAMPRGTLVTAGTAGTFRLQWCQQAGVANNSTLYAQSWVRLQRCA